MEMDLVQVKNILRSILISAPVVIDVNQLKRDFIEQVGTGIPFSKFGFKSLFEFLKSIPDVLTVDGEKGSSEVFVVHSEKSAHVNELVMKQKLCLKPGQFSSNRNRNMRQKTRSYYNSKRRYTNSMCDHINQSQKTYDAYDNIHQTNHICDKNDRLENITNYTDKKNTSPHQTAATTISKSPQNTRRDLQEPNKRLNNDNIIENLPQGTSETEKTNSKDMTRSGKAIVANTPQNSENLFGVDISLKPCKPMQDENYWRGGLTSNSKKANNNVKSWSETEHDTNWRCTPRSGQANQIEKPKLWRETENSRSGKIMQNPWRKQMKVTNKPEQHKNKDNEVNEDTYYRKIHNHVPTRVQVNLQKLISDFPDGILCEELPVAYKKVIGETLCFEMYGYRYLIYLCMDLSNIFHVVKESSSDYRLYDARNPLPKPKTVPDLSFEETVEEAAIPDSNLAIPEMIWGSFICLPDNVIKLGFKIKRIEAANVFVPGTVINVMVADIYDISKFWIIVDDSKLEDLMKDIQLFYEKNRQKYLIPKSLLVEGLYIVALYGETFHRAIILNSMLGEDYLKVHYFDYGTLGMVSKDQVWFLTKPFSELPSQAIRSKLCDIYPPHKGLTWSPFANYEFTRLASMKKFQAHIVQINNFRNSLDIRLFDGYSYISDILVDLKYAIFLNKTPKKYIEDPHCKPKVEYLHLFPSFEEIENWVVPSMAEASEFFDTPVTADFLYPQYFSRTNHTELIESIEEKMSVISQKKRLLMKDLKESDEKSFFRTGEDMNEIAYAGVYIPENLEENNIYENGIEVEQKKVSQRGSRMIDIEYDETMIGIMRRTRLSKSFEDKSNTEIGEHQNTYSGNLLGENSSWQRTYGTLLNDSCKLSELEKYLSEDSSKASKKSIPNLIDLDTDISPVEPTANLLGDCGFEQSVVMLERSRNKEKCILTDSSTDDVEENILDLPIPDNVQACTALDLIKFESESSFVTSSDELQPEKHNLEIGTSEFEDADDEDSDGKLNSLESRVHERQSGDLDSTSIQEDFAPSENNSIEIVEQISILSDQAMVTQINTEQDGSETQDCSNVTLPSLETDITQLSKSSKDHTEKLHSDCANNMKLQSSVSSSTFFTCDGEHSCSTEITSIAQHSLNEDNSFLEEFEIVDHFSGSSDMRSEAAISRQSFVSKEWMTSELPTSQCEIDSVHQNTCIAENIREENENMNSTDTKCSSKNTCYSTSETESIDNVQENLVPASSSSSSLAVNPVPSVPSSNMDESTENIQENPLPTSCSCSSVPINPVTCVYTNNMNVQSQNPQAMIFTGATPTFIPVPVYGHTRVLYPYVPGMPNHILSGHHQQIVNEVTQLHNTPPIVIFNYLPCPYPNPRTNQPKND